MVLFLALLFLAVVVSLLKLMPRRRVQPGQAPWPDGERQAMDDALPAPTGPDSLAVQTRAYFFSRSQSEFFRTVEQALPPGYRVFPNVRLNDVFVVTGTESAQHSTDHHLKNTHVDCLIVELPDHRPVAAVELSGKHPASAPPPHADDVKDSLFRHAGLLLLRLQAEELHSPAALEGLLWQHLRPAERTLVS